MAKRLNLPIGVAVRRGSYGSGPYSAKKRKYGYTNYLVTLLVRVF